MNVPIPPEFSGFVDEVVTKGAFANRREVLRAALKMLLQREQLKQDIAAGIVQLDSGQSTPAEVVLKRLQSKANDLASE